MTAIDITDQAQRTTLADRTALCIGAMALIVRDMDLVASFYRDAIGLDIIDRAAKEVRLGLGGVTLLTLVHHPRALPDDVREAGLYHTAFVMPTRAWLGRWVGHALRCGVALSGCSDHAVSEAIYLDDPEGNGVEIYADRPPSQWRWLADKVEMTTEPLDVDELMAACDTAAPYERMPPGTRIGHVHLRVGDVAMAERFYSGSLGLQVTRRRTGATFMSDGRYHHHVACNAWSSAGSGARDPARAGLDRISLEAADASVRSETVARLLASGVAIETTGDAISFCDPWGTRLQLVVAT
ncbi:MAG: VOC family protein [Proteobacteria bacterium]|nr:VOC family protein [Pseudomonadota bacterium]